MNHLNVDVFAVITTTVTVPMAGVTVATMTMTMPTANILMKHFHHQQIHAQATTRSDAHDFPCKHTHIMLQRGVWPERHERGATAAYHPQPQGE